MKNFERELKTQGKKEGMLRAAVIGTALVTVAVALCFLKAGESAKSQEVRQPTDRKADLKSGTAGALRGCEVVASAERGFTFSSEPVVVAVSVKNTGEEEVRYIDSTPELLFSFVVKNSRGEVMPRTRYGQKLINSLKDGDSSRRIRQRIVNGDKRSYRFLINQMFDMTVPDKYAITTSIAVGIGNSAKYVTVTSLPTKVEVGGFDGSMPANVSSEAEPKAPQ